MCCTGEKVEMQDLRTPEQKQMIAQLLPVLLSGIQRGPTPFGGQMLSQPPDPSMMQAMNVMAGVGGQGPYRFPGMQAGPYGPPPQVSPGGYNPQGPPTPPGGGGGTGNTGPGGGGGDPYDPWRMPPDEDWEDPFKEA